MIFGEETTDCVRMEVTLTEEEREMLLKAAYATITKEEKEELLIEWMIIKAITELAETEQLEKED